ncbi:MAG: twin-arginine translocation signal domain-containing protein [Planctomycetes bacterium]|nr:twin-arginine translocation signal domain-containing protein [Planctomycetota bacterium]
MAALDPGAPADPNPDATPASRRTFLKLCGAAGLGACCPALDLLPGAVRAAAADDSAGATAAAAGPVSQVVLREARHYDRLPENRIQCHICPFD